MPVQSMQGSTRKRNICEGVASSSSRIHSSQTWEVGLVKMSLDRLLHSSVPYSRKYRICPIKTIATCEYQQFEFREIAAFMTALWVFNSQIHAESALPRKLVPVNLIYSNRLFDTNVPDKKSCAPKPYSYTQENVESALSKKFIPLARISKEDAKCALPKQCIPLNIINFLYLGVSENTSNNWA